PVGVVSLWTTTLLQVAPFYLFLAKVLKIVSRLFQEITTEQMYQILDFSLSFFDSEIMMIHKQWRQLSY
ncbi:MAG: hypothetical protein PVG14_17745, partial [Anaerolineales bacterium]